jgi:aspartate kinase
MVPFKGEVDDAKPFTGTVARMKVFKFGGASVKDEAGVRNVASVLRLFPEEDLVMVVSAMGKTTNALEAVVRARTDGRGAAEMVDALRQNHLAVLAGVAPRNVEARADLMAQFDRLEETLRNRVSPGSDRDYDAIVSFGELWSTLIVTAHLDAVGLKTCWVDARTMVSTDALYRSARIDWAASGTHAPAVWAGVSGSPRRLLTQGFVGRAPNGTTTTLGREGSDFSAAILAYLLDAESVTIWKDVPGMFNADPKRFPDTKLLSHISYREAIELSYFGASVIHPRTLQPLQKKHIPLYVRSFTDASAPGTTIDDHHGDDSLIPSFILKGAQLLISITPRDLSFIVEENLSDIFGLFARNRVRIELMQNSAVAFSVAVDDTPRARALIEELGREFDVRYNERCELVTVRHFDEPTVQRLTEGKEILIEQRSRNTARFVLK